jgi:hypothetical protein
MKGGKPVTQPGQFFRRGGFDITLNFLEFSHGASPSFPTSVTAIASLTANVRGPGSRAPRLPHASPFTLHLFLEDR